MTLDPLLIEVLACPLDKGPLLWFAEPGVLYNPRLHRRYEVRDGIPVLLVDESTVLDDQAHQALMAQAAGAVETGPPERREGGDAGQ